MEKEAVLIGRVICSCILCSDVGYERCTSGSGFGRPPGRFGRWGLDLLVIREPGEGRNQRFEGADIIRSIFAESRSDSSPINRRPRDWIRCFQPLPPDGSLSRGRGCCAVWRRLSLLVETHDQVGTEGNSASERVNDLRSPRKDTTGMWVSFLSVQLLLYYLGKLLEVEPGCGWHRRQILVNRL